MNKRNIAYWATTGLLSFALLGSGIMKLAGAEEVAKNMAHVGVPGWMMPLLGFWMVAAVAALLAPGTARLKEWAYAGIVFQMTGGLVAHLAVGDPLGAAFPTVVLTALAVASYVLRPATRALAPIVPQTETTQAGTRAHASA